MRRRARDFPSRVGCAEGKLTKLRRRVGSSVSGDRQRLNAWPRRSTVIPCRRVVDVARRRVALHRRRIAAAQHDPAAVSCCKRRTLTPTDSQKGDEQRTQMERLIVSGESHRAVLWLQRARSARDGEQAVERPPVAPPVEAVPAGRQVGHRLARWRLALPRRGSGISKNFTTTKLP